MAKVTVYSTHTCPYCKMLKEWLTEKKIAFVNHFVDEDTAKMEEMMKVSEGHMGVPFSIVKKDDGGEVKIVGFDKGKFEEALGLK
jgi:glutaredoxin 3